MATMTLAEAPAATISPADGSILVTGISGFIGKHVAARLTAAGYEVVGLTHSSTLPPEVAALCSRMHSGDLGDPLVLEQALDGVAGICHLAAHLPPDYANPGEAAACLTVNALGTLELARAALRQGVRRMIYASASNAYRPAAQPVTEDQQVWPVGHAPWYLTSKVAAEFYLEHLRNSAGLSPVTLRIASCYGPGMTARSVVASFVACAQRGEPLDVFDGGRSQADFVHVLDVADCFVVALSAGDAGIYNVGSGCATTLIDLAQAAKVAFGSSSPVRVRPARDPGPTRFPAVSVTKAAQAWGYAPMSLRAGLATFATSP